MTSQATYPVTEPETPTHPGEILSGLYMDEYALTAYRLAKEIGVGQSGLGKILKGERSITAEMDLRLSAYFSVTRGMWLNLQNKYDLKIAEAKKGRAIKKITPIAAE
ncbi:HigA family addiction module antitoxin [Kiloniella sp.]|uniref:HigA family addiction module antitoxin n=1 Tax=Kiloniella sp. TaxID=1938587 RepID=UPI003B02E2BC